jgi:hypothetical protein
MANPPPPQVPNAANMGIGTTTYMMQNAIVSASSKFIESGVWWIDMILLIFVMSFVGSVMQSFPTWITECKDWLYQRFRQIKNTFFKKYQIELTDTVNMNIKSGFSWRPSETRNNVHLVQAITYYLNNNSPIVRIKSNLRNDGEGSNEYTRLLDHTFQYDSCDPKTTLSNGITVYVDSVNKFSNNTSEVLIQTTNVLLQSSQSHQHIKDFMDQVYKDYVDRYYKKFDVGQQLHYYTLDAGRSMVMTSLSSDKDRGNDKMQLSNWRRYNLEVTRTFESLFFDEKESVLKLVDYFLEKKGIYALDSIPYKLSFLLYGSPGTGKTSFIKALANLTKRHVINVSLPLIETNGQILDIFQNTVITYFDQYGKQTDTVPLNKRIYILEDIDALSKIVEIRREKQIAEHQKKDTKKIVTKKSDTKPDESTNTTTTNESTDTSPESSSDTSDTSNTSDKSDEPICTDKPVSSLTPLAPLYYKSQFERYMLQSDELNLSGLLNVLDGLMELTGSIVILTTNYPERLDKALIRPGRITKQLHMGNMSIKSIQDMVTYYFKEPLPKISEGIQITPAQMENICLSATNVQEVQSELTKQFI